MASAKPAFSVGQRVLCEALSSQAPSWCRPRVTGVIKRLGKISAAVAPGDVADRTLFPRWPRSTWWKSKGPLWKVDYVDMVPVSETGVNSQIVHASWDWEA